MDLDTRHTFDFKGKLTKERRKEGTEEKQGHLCLDIQL